MKALTDKIEAMGKARYVSTIDTSESTSDNEILSNYSDSMARSATANVTTSTSVPYL